jgi:U3 small nucleolar RNA-associated protein 10
MSAELSAQQRFWERVTESLYDLLNRLAALLAPASFVAVVKELLHHPVAPIRRRSLTFFNDYLRTNYGASKKAGAVAARPPEELQLYFDLLMDLGGVLKTAASSPTPSTATLAAANATGSGAPDDDEDSNTQAVLDAMCILAAHLAKDYPAPFAAAMPRVLDLGWPSAPLGVPVAVVTGTSSSRKGVRATGAIVTAPLAAQQAVVALPVRASALLCAAVLCQHLGPRAIPHLPVLLPRLLDALEWSTGAAGGVKGAGFSRDSVVALQLSALTALRLCANALPQFLHPILPRALQVSSVRVIRILCAHPPCCV